MDGRTIQTALSSKQMGMGGATHCTSASQDLWWLNFLETAMFFTVLDGDFLISNSEPLTIEPLLWYKGDKTQGNVILLENNQLFCANSDSTLCRSILQPPDVDYIPLTAAQCV